MIISSVLFDFVCGITGTLSKEYVQFIRSLYGVKDSGYCLKLKDAYVWADETFGNKVYIRECYSALYDILVVERMLTKHLSTVLAGNPGIGKVRDVCE